MQNSHKCWDIFCAEYLSIIGFLKSAGNDDKRFPIFCQKSETASTVWGISKTAYFPESIFLVSRFMLLFSFIITPTSYLRLPGAVVLGSSKAIPNITVLSLKRLCYFRWFLNFSINNVFS